MNLVVGAHTREVKTGLFVALSGIPNVTIAAAASSTAELRSYCSTFHPDVIIAEVGLPGRPLGEVLEELDASGAVQRVLLIEGDGTENSALPQRFETLKDVDHLLTVLLAPDLDKELE